MKPNERLLELIGNIPEEMLEEALAVKKIYRSGKKRVFYAIAAAACIVVLFMRFVPMGQVIAAQIREHVERLLEELFPPKDIPLTMEGLEENILHEAYGELPKETEAFPGEAEQKIREIMEMRQEFYNSFPTAEIRITQKQEVSVEDAAGEMKVELSEHYTAVSDIMVSELPKGLYIRADEGTAWDCEVKEVYFADNGLGGVFVITASYIVEAAEGTGVRFHSMIETFKVLESSDYIQILTSEEAGIAEEAAK